MELSLVYWLLKGMGDGTLIGLKSNLSTGIRARDPPTPLLAFCVSYSRFRPLKQVCESVDVVCLVKGVVILSVLTMGTAAAYVLLCTSSSTLYFLNNVKTEVHSLHATVLSQLTHVFSSKVI